MTQRRKVIGYAVALMLCAVRWSDTEAQPVVPCQTNFSHSEHHWILWTPKHPVYEAVEVRSADNDRISGGKSIRVFFTERQKRFRVWNHKRQKRFLAKGKTTMSDAEDILGEVQELLAGRETAAARKRNNNQNINNKRAAAEALGVEEGEVEELLAGRETAAARKKNNNQHINNKRTAETE